VLSSETVCLSYLCEGILLSIKDAADRDAVIVRIEHYVLGFVRVFLKNLAQQMYNEFHWGRVIVEHQDIPHSVGHAFLLAP